MLSKPVANILQKHLNGTSIHHRIELLKVLLREALIDKRKPTQSSKDKKVKVSVKSDLEKNNFMPLIKGLLGENIVNNFLRVNEFEGITYFNKERFEELLRWLLLISMTEIPLLAKAQLAVKSKTTKAEIDKEILNISKNYYERFVEQASPPAIPSFG